MTVTCSISFLCLSNVISRNWEFFFLDITAYTHSKEEKKKKKEEKKIRQKNH